MPWAPRKTVKGACTPVLATLRDRGGGGPRVPPPDDFDEEREANYNSIIRFGQRAFPHWIRAECSQFHRHVDRTAQRMLKGPGSHKRADMAPRANAKSTWISNVLPIWIAAHAERLEQEHDRLFRCILIISYAISLPSSFVRNIRRELEGNDYLARYYPEIHGEGGDKWTQTSIRTKNGIWIIAGAIGGNLRGKIEESHRPELTVLDDTESAEQAQTFEQRDKMIRLVDQDVQPLSSATGDIWAAGTLVHRESLLASLKNRWEGRRFQSVIRWSKHPELWEEWEEIYLDLQGELGQGKAYAKALWEEAHETLLGAVDTGEDPEDLAEALHGQWTEAWAKAVKQPPDGGDKDLRDALVDALVFCDDFRPSLPDDIEDLEDQWEDAVLDFVCRAWSRKGKAWDFFKAHETEMLEGTKVLWPEVEDYYSLMCQKAEVANPASWFQEKQNVSRRAEEHLFPWTKWATYPVPDKIDTKIMRALFPRDAIFIGAVDPSMGKQDKRRDYQATVIIGSADRGATWRIAWARLRREHPTQIMENVFRLHEVFRCRRWIFETNQFQELFAHLVLDTGRKRGIHLPVKEIPHSGDKDLRIQGLEGIVSSGHLAYPGKPTPDGKLTPVFGTLWEQFDNYGEKDVHDDGPDAVQMAWEEADKLGRLKPMRTTTVRHDFSREATAAERAMREMTPAEREAKPSREERRRQREEERRAKREGRQVPQDRKRQRGERCEHCRFYTKLSGRCAQHEERRDVRDWCDKFVKVDHLQRLMDLAEQAERQ